ncbi:MAG: hypothetical protein HUU55_20555 [Myxococcales bacterium]|nr:hypothetical protein [Myxococcales bacterium]
MAVELQIITGLLGSGKTSVVVHLLGAPAFGDRLGVIIGEFADEGYDASMLGETEHTVAQIAGTGRREPEDTYLPEVRALLQSGLHRRIILETSGVVEPWKLVSALRNDVYVRRHAHFGKALTVIDAGSWERHYRLFTDQMKALIGMADVVVVNKTDKVHPGDLDTIRGEVNTINPAATVQFAYMGQVSRPVVLSGFREGERARIDTISQNDSLPADFESFVYRTPLLCVDRVFFGHRLLNLPGNVARFKGVLRCWDRSYAVNGLPGQLDWDNIKVTGATRIALIGLNLLSNEAEIREILDSELKRQLDDDR